MAISEAETLHRSGKPAASALAHRTVSTHDLSLCRRCAWDDIGDPRAPVEPPLQASPGLRFHAIAATGAFPLGVTQLAGPKGTLPHRIDLGPTGARCGGQRLLHSFWGPWSPVHLLAIFTLALLPVAVWRAHRHAVEQHRRAILGLFFGTSVGAGLFASLPGRIMHWCQRDFRLCGRASRPLEHSRRQLRQGHALRTMTDTSPTASWSPAFL